MPLKDDATASLRPTMLSGVHVRGGVPMLV
jgi:hypothetical protein